MASLTPTQPFLPTSCDRPYIAYVDDVMTSSCIALATFLADAHAMTMTLASCHTGYDIACPSCKNVSVQECCEPCDRLAFLLSSDRNGHRIIDRCAHACRFDTRAPRGDKLSLARTPSRPRAPTNTCDTSCLVHFVENECFECPFMMSRAHRAHRASTRILVRSK